MLLCIFGMFENGIFGLLVKFQIKYNNRTICPSSRFKLQEAKSISCTAAIVMKYMCPVILPVKLNPYANFRPLRMEPRAGLALFPGKWYSWQVTNYSRDDPQHRTSN